jgi:hypothetical protein
VEMSVWSRALDHQWSWGRVMRFLVLLLAPLFAIPPGVAQQNPEPPLPELSIIVVSSETEAGRVLDRLHAGEDFGQLAREKSIDPSAQNGGSLGRMDPASLRTELRDALRATGPGHVAGPIKIPTGYAILRIGAQSGTGAPKTEPAATSAQAAPPGVQAKA